MSLAVSVLSLVAEGRVVVVVEGRVLILKYMVVDLAEP